MFSQRKTKSLFKKTAIIRLVLLILAFTLAVLNLIYRVCIYSLSQEIGVMNKKLMVLEEEHKHLTSSYMSSQQVENIELMAKKRLAMTDPEPLLFIPLRNVHKK